jgi:hypothetical protein
MPFAALCRRCRFFMIGETKGEITSKVRRHFKNSHSKFPRPDPVFLDMSDFEPNTVYLTRGSGGRITYSSRLFCSQEYCLAVVTEKDYNSCRLSGRTQEFLSACLSDYFPVV